MGLLDDAIREHLELKRLRGADPSEIARAEREALGPVRRAVDPAEEDGSETAPALATEPEESVDEVAHADPGVELFDDHAQLGTHPATIPPTEEHEDVHGHAPAAFEASVDDPDEWLAPEPPQAESMPGHEGATPPPEAVEQATQVLHPPAGEPDPVRPPPPAPARPLPEESRHDPDDAGVPPEPPPPQASPGVPAGPPSAGEDPTAASPEHEDGEDVLEETPDFLQETPEHDRLWFEQRPPRDFDFDK